MATEKHPYAEIISKYKPNEWQLEKKEPMQPKPLDDTPVTVVDSEPLLYELVDVLKESQEVAVSVYHDKSSFHGKIGLLVFSTRSEEFVVDPNEMRDKMSVLNEIFMSTSILKVMLTNLGSKNKENRKLTILQRLQKDFGIYIVNLFDLGFATQAVEKRRVMSERVLLIKCVKECFGIELSEEFMKDFTTTRPISPEVIRFVGEETHYLLPLYDVYRNKLIEREKPWYADALVDVYKKCAATTSVLWRPDDLMLKPNAYKNHLSNEKFTPTQTECFRLIHDWRWKLAEESDKLLKDVMATDCMKRIAKALPTTSAEIAACCEGDVSDMVLNSIEDIQLLVLKAKCNEKKVEMNENANSATKQTVSVTPAKHDNEKSTYKSVPPAKSEAEKNTYRSVAPAKYEAVKNTYSTVAPAKYESVKSSSEPVYGAVASETVTEITKKQSTPVNSTTVAENKQPALPNSALSYGQQKAAEKDKYKQCFTCSKYGHVSKDCQSAVPWGPMGQYGRLGYSMTGEAGRIGSGFSGSRFQPYYKR